MKVKRDMSKSNCYKLRATAKKLHRVSIKVNLKARMAFLGEVIEEWLGEVHDVDSLEEKLIKMECIMEKLLEEARIHFSLQMREVELMKDVERLRLIVENVATKADNLSTKVEGIEVTVEAMTTGVPKEVFVL